MQRPKRRRRHLHIEELECRELLTTQLVADLNQLQRYSSSPRDIVSLDGHSYFFANVDEAVEFWKSDGTESGTSRVSRFDPELIDSHPFDLVASDSSMFFSTAFANWRSDGTPGGTFNLDLRGTAWAIASDHLLLVRTSKTIVDVRNGSTVDIGRANRNDRIVGAVDDGFLLFQSKRPPDSPVQFSVVHVDFSGNYTTLATEVLEDDVFHITEDGMFRLGAEFAFVHFHPFEGEPRLLLDVPETGFADAEIVQSGASTFFFGTTSAVEGGITTTLYRSDGTTNGTSAISSFATQAIERATVADGKGGVWFTVTSSDDNTSEIWFSDGTTSGTNPVKEIAARPAASRPHSFTASPNGERIWFVANDGQDNQVWTSDGTAQGSFAVSDLDATSDPNILAVTPQEVVYSVGTREYGIEIWTSDGTTDGTRLLRDINDGPGDSLPGYFTRVSDTEFHFVATGPQGRELWKTDLTTEGTMQVKDLNESEATLGSAPNNLTKFNDQLLFTANDGHHGSELWVLPSAGDVPILLSDIHPGPGGSFADHFTLMGETLFFTADDGIHGRELWQTDGTTEGTVMVSDLLSGERGSLPQSLLVVDGQLFFLARNDLTPIEYVEGVSRLNTYLEQHAIWTLQDGQPMAIFQPDFDAGGQISRLHALGKSIAFLESQATENDMFARTLSPSGEMSTFSSSDLPASWLDMESIASQLIYPVHNGMQTSLWAMTQGSNELLHENAEPVLALNRMGHFVEFTDGLGTKILDPLSKTTVRTSHDLVNAFKIDDVSFVLTSDGLYAGDAFSFSDVRIGPEFGDVLPGTQTIDSEVYFRAREMSGETQIWKSDGTTEGTRRVTNNLGPAGIGGSPGSLVLHDSQLYFSANELIHGRELWTLEPAEANRGDVNGDGAVDYQDIDSLYAAIASGNDAAKFDLNSDDVVDALDVDSLLSMLRVRLGDTDLDGDVDFGDFLALSASFGSTNANWSTGDFTGDEQVSFDDFLLLSTNFGRTFGNA